MQSSRTALHLLSLMGLLSATAADLANLVTLSDYVAAPWGARSLDGTPYELWIAPAASGSANATKWVLEFQGGGWCESIESCAQRAYDPKNCYLGSTREHCFNVNGERCHNKTSRMTWECLPACNGDRWCGGLFSNNSVTNPLTHDWNKVLLPYHDGGSFSGRNDTVTWTTYAGQRVPLYFRGHRNLLASVSYLKQHAGLGRATEVIVTGNSAGGLATYFHMDELATLLPAECRFHAAPDSGFFATAPDYPQWRDSLLNIVQFMNSTAGLDASCVEALTASGGNPATCAFPEVVARHVTTPTFVMNSRFDPALDGITEGAKASNIPRINAIGARVLQLINQTLLGDARGNAAFVTSCHEHCGQWAQGTDDFNVTIDGWQAIPSLMSWRDGGARKVWVQEASFPCDACCQGGQL